MIQTLIIEDEQHAAERLKKLVENLGYEIQVVDMLDSVESAVEWFRSNDHPDLVFLDIQLADGVSFDIFNKVKVESAIVFTTAYDEYAIKAFEVNSIDYLLKPINQDKLKKSLDKYLAFKPSGQTVDIQSLLQMIDVQKKKYKTRFLINAGSRLKSVEITDVAYFCSMEKSTFLCTSENKTYDIDFSLDKLEVIIDPEQFFRINRKFIVNYKAIKDISVYSKSKIKLKVIPEPEEETIVSNAKAAVFRKWLDR